jgi:hypothetical protein
MALALAAIAAPALAQVPPTTVVIGPAAGGGNTARLVQGKMPVMDAFHTCVQMHLQPLREAFIAQAHFVPGENVHDDWVAFKKTHATEVSAIDASCHAANP